MINKLTQLAFFAVVAWLLSSGQTLWAQGREIAILERANTALNEFEAMPFYRLMPGQLRKAQGVAIFPGMFKVAAGVGGRHGRGVLLTREADGSWGLPVFLKMSGASAGIQLGIEKTDLVLIFRTRSDSERLKQGRFTLGLDDVLAIGSIGVDKFIGTDAGLETCILSPSSPSRGLYAGWSLEGNRLHIDSAATSAYEQYEQDWRNNGPMSTRAPSPSLRLQMRLARLSASSTTP